MIKHSPTGRRIVANLAWRYRRAKQLRSMFQPTHKLFSMYFAAEVEAKNAYATSRRILDGLTIE